CAAALTSPSVFCVSSCAVHYRAVHSFPTRRSSDLHRERDCSRCVPPVAVAHHVGELVGAREVETWRVRHASVWIDAGQTRRKREDRKSTRLNSSHGSISYAVFCLKKKKLKANRHSN